MVFDMGPMMATMALLGLVVLVAVVLVIAAAVKYLFPNNDGKGQ